MLDLFSPSEIQAFLSIVAIDIVMSGDNAIIIGLAAAGLPPELRRRAIAIGIVAATILRISFAAVTVQLLQIVGLTLAGGLLLLWVCWKMWRELRSGHHGADPTAEAASGKAPVKSFRQALTMIVVADVSMSLDNVLAVAGAARIGRGCRIGGKVGIGGRCRGRFGVRNTAKCAVFCAACFWNCRFPLGFEGCSQSFRGIPCAEDERNASAVGHRRPGCVAG